MHSIPMILETPAPEQETWAEEIKLLYWMVGRESGDPELLAREAELQEKGKEDREKQIGALRRKEERKERDKVKEEKKRKKLLAKAALSKSSSESESASASESGEDSDDSEDGRRY
jgi:hypothetical protein